MAVAVAAGNFPLQRSTAALREGDFAAGIGWVRKRPAGWLLEVEGSERDELDEGRLVDGSWVDLLSAPLVLSGEKDVVGFLSYCVGLWVDSALQLKSISAITSDVLEHATTVTRSQLTGSFRSDQIVDRVARIPEDLQSSCGAITAVGEQAAIRGLELSVQHVTSELEEWLAHEDQQTVVLCPTVWRSTQ